jgi:outer membrane protein assembly factor BamB
VGGTLYAIAESTGAVVWTNAVANGDSSSPAVSAQGVYVSYPCQVYDFEPASGVLLWHYNGGYDGGGGRTPVLAGGKLYVRDLPGNTVFDSADGSTLGSFASAFTPAVTATTAFMLTDEGTLNWTDLQSGATKFSFTGDGSLVTPPIVIDQQVVVGSSSGNLYALDTSSAVLQWQVKVPSGILPADHSENTSFFTGLAAANGILVVPAGTTLVAYSLLGPAAPTALTAAGGVGALALSWTASLGATAYNVYMGSSPGREDVVPVATNISGTSFEVTTGLTPGTAYYFTVKRADAGGLSAPSNEASAVVTSPAAPTGLAAKPGGGSVTLSWTAASGATSYSVYQSTTAGSEGTAAVQTVAGTQATISGLMPGGRYYFSVKALAHSIASPGSGKVSAAAGIAAPHLVVTNGHLEVLLTWNAVEGAASYNVYSGTSSGGESATPLASGITGAEFVVSNLNAATTYYFVVRAVAGSTMSDPSNEVSVRPDPGNGGGTGGGGGTDPLSLVIIGWFAARMSRSRRDPQGPERCPGT